MQLADRRLDMQYRQVYGMSVYLRQRLMAYPAIVFNSDETCIPHILNISVLGTPSVTLQKRLEAEDIFVSTQTACHTGSSRSESVYRLTGDEQRATSSLRISLSHLTTRDELDAIADAIGEE